MKPGAQPTGSSLAFSAWCQGQARDDTMPQFPLHHGPCWDISAPQAARAAGTSVPLQRCRGKAKPRPGLLMPSLSPRYSEGSGGSGDEGRDEDRKREWNLFYQKQMSLRKVKGVGLWGARCLLLTPS